jgi:hypothetical protein
MHTIDWNRNQNINDTFSGWIGFAAGAPLPDDGEQKASIRLFQTKRQ